MQHNLHGTRRRYHSASRLVVYRESGPRNSGVLRLCRDDLGSMTGSGRLLVGILTHTVHVYRTCWVGFPPSADKRKKDMIRKDVELCSEHPRVVRKGVHLRNIHFVLLQIPEFQPETPIEHDLRNLYQVESPVCIRVCSTCPPRVPPPPTSLHHQKQCLLREGTLDPF